MAMLIPHSLPADEVQPYLTEGERVVSSFGPYHATSRRVILVIPARAGIHLAQGARETRVHELPYTALESITEVRRTDRKKMLLGACLSALGLATIFAWYLIVPIVAVVAGVFIILQGSNGKARLLPAKGTRHGGRRPSQVAGHTLRVRQLYRLDKHHDRRGDCPRLT